MSTKMATRIELLDGGTGEELMRIGLPDDRKTWSAYALTHEEHRSKVITVHRSFLRAGSHYITCNNYGVIPSHFCQEDIVKYTKVAGELAVQARKDEGRGDAHICGSLPPLTESYRPDLVLPMEQGQEIYTLIGTTLVPYVDLFLAETMSCIREAIMAIHGVQHLGKPIFVSFTLRKDSCLRSGESLNDAIQALMQQMSPPEAILLNCCEPEVITAALEMLDTSLKTTLVRKRIRLGAYANALTPVPDGWTMEGTPAAQPLRTDLPPQVYVQHAQRWMALGVTIIGGCCGVGPLHIEALALSLK
jgi:S-methylmethionine-dependent homocysteine/selenocysteine methylase